MTKTKRRPAAGSCDHLWQIEGERNGRWMGLYQYHNRPMARAIYNHILTLDEEGSLPPELRDFEDFRLIPPKEDNTPEPEEQEQGSTEETPKESPARRRRRKKSAPGKTMIPSKRKRSEKSTTGARSGRTRRSRGG